VIIVNSQRQIARNFARPSSDKVHAPSPEYSEARRIQPVEFCLNRTASKIPNSNPGPDSEATGVCLSNPGRLLLGKKRVKACWTNPMCDFIRRFEGNEWQNLNRFFGFHPDIQPHGNPPAPGALSQHAVMPQGREFARLVKYVRVFCRVGGSGKFPIGFLVEQGQDS